MYRRSPGCKPNSCQPRGSATHPQGSTQPITQPPTATPRAAPTHPGLSPARTRSHLGVANAVPRTPQVTRIAAPPLVTVVIAGSTGDATQKAEAPQQHLKVLLPHAGELRGKTEGQGGEKKPKRLREVRSRSELKEEREGCGSQKGKEK